MKAALITSAGRISLDATPVKIGSAASNELSLNDTLAAPVHAEITLVEGGYQLTDLGSPQGTRVNDQAVSPSTPLLLQHGDSISIGETHLIFELSTSAEVESASSAAHIDEAPTELITPALIEETPEKAAPLAVNEEAPTDLVDPEVSTAVREAALTSASEFTTEILPRVQAPVEVAVSATLPQEEAPAPAQPIPSAAPLYAAAQPPLPPGGQPIPYAIPLQAFTPVGQPIQPGVAAIPPAGMITGALPQAGYPAPAYTQPGYTPLPGQFQTPPAPANKKRSQVLFWAILIVVVLLLLAGSNTATYALTHPPTPKPIVNTLPSPKITLQSYCQGILTNNAQQIYDLLSEQAKIHTSLDDIQQKFSMFNILNGSSSGMSVKYTNCTSDDIRVSNPLAVATVTLTLSITMPVKTQDGTTTSTISESTSSLTSLVWEKNQWKIDFSSMSQPQPTVL